jgi:hypothetical protein
MHPRPSFPFGQHGVDAGPSVCEKTSHRFFRGKFYSNNNTNTSNNILVISRTKPL